MSVLVSRRQKINVAGQSQPKHSNAWPVPCFKNAASSSGGDKNTSFSNWMNTDGPFPPPPLFLAHPSLVFETDFLVFPPSPPPFQHSLFVPPLPTLMTTVEETTVTFVLIFVSVELSNAFNLLHKLHSFGHILSINSVCVEHMDSGKPDVLPQCRSKSAHSPTRERLLYINTFRLLCF